METVWNGKEMVQVTEAEAIEMVEKDLGQWMRKHNGSALKHRHEFTGYQNKAMTTDTTPKEKKAPAKKKKAPAKKATPKDSEK